jgi:Icc-related predicted phosphoesterase
MKILAVSDIHVEKHGYSMLDEIVKQKADVLLTGGDIAHGNGAAEKSYSMLQAFPGIKLAYLGNHELSTLVPNIGNHHEELSAFYGKYGFHLLDAKPCTVEGISFIANSGWFDFSLYRKEISPEMLARAERMMRLAYKQTDTSFANICLDRLLKDYSEIAYQSKKVVVGIHHIFMKEMMRKEDDIRDLFLGSEIYKCIFPLKKVVAGFCGHTHRPGEFELHGKKIYNISYTKDKPYTMVEI